jgi:hypothetical protein
MDAAVREAVRRRAGSRCEYCRAVEGSASRLRFHIEHITARQHRGGDDLGNLALACHLCNAHKGPNLSGIDPVTATHVPLFHPRSDRWEEHFTESAGEILGLTPVGRATVAVLDMNHPARIALRLGIDE